MAFCVEWRVMIALKREIKTCESFVPCTLHLLFRVL